MDFIRPSTITTIMATPNTGKSLLAQNIACHIAKQNKKVLFCSCEMSGGSLMERQLKQVMGVTSKQLIEGYKKHPETIEKIFDTLTNNKDFEYLKNIAILEIGRIHIDKLISILQECKEFKFVIIDYIQRISGEGDSPYSKLADVSHKLQFHAIDSGQAIIEVAQIPKIVETASKSVKKDVDFTTLRAKGAGDIEEDAHVAIMMVEDIGSDGERYVLINLSKNKYGNKKRITYKYLINPRLNFQLVQKDV